MAEICPRVNDYSYHFIPRKNNRRIYSSDPLEGRERVSPVFVFKCCVSVYTQPMGIYLSGRILKLMLPCHEIHTRIDGFMTNINAHSMACGLPRHLRQCKHWRPQVQVHTEFIRLHICKERDLFLLSVLFLPCSKKLSFQSQKCELHSTLLFRFCFALFLQMSRFLCG